MTRRIRQRLQEIRSFPNVIYDHCDMRGKWNSNYFKNENPIILELGCGRGDYSIALAQLYLEKNMIGVDIRGARLWKGAKFANEHNLKNVAFLEVSIENICNYFEADEVSEIWLPFPDPFPKRRYAKHRLTSPRFLDLYRQIIVENGKIHLKTDDEKLFLYTLKILRQGSATIHKAIEDLYSSNIEDKLLLYKTTYEQRYINLGKSIKYINFSL